MYPPLIVSVPLYVPIPVELMSDPVIVPPTIEDPVIVDPALISPAKDTFPFDVVKVNLLLVDPPL